MPRRVLLLLVLALVPAMAVSVGALPTAEGGRNPLEATPDRRLEHIAVDGRDRLDAIVDLGFDVTHEVRRIPTGWEAQVVVDDADLAALVAMGADRLAADERFDWTAESARMQDAVAGFRAAALPTARRALAGAAQDGVDHVDIGRVDRFESKDQQFLSVEAKSSMADAAVAMLLLWNAGDGTPAGSGGAQVMTAFTDSGEYMYHRVLAPVEVVPTEVTVISLLGGSDTAPAEEWLYETDSLLDQPGYRSGFIDGYQDPTTMFARLEELAAEHPDVAEIVDLAADTNGYQRPAQAVIGSGSSAVVVSSVAWGHEGGNDLTVALVPAGDAAGPGAVTIDGDAITVAVDATTTAADVIAALDLEAGHLVDAHGYRTSGTDGVVTPTAAPVALTDGLSAPIERGPFDVRAIRIGRHRDGSRPGVLIIAQDHAREWVPPLIAMEAVERLLANHETDPVSADIIDNVDIWVIPSNNPDGSHYSMYDYAMQRKSMTNHCEEDRSDPGYRDSWGVDLNRGYSVGSRRDGFAGASGVCTSGNYDGPGELSEPETINVVSLVEQHDNIRYFMTIHSNGGQLFWQPGTYIADGRLTPTRPPLGDETYYWEMAERILSEVKTYQDTVVRPDLVGGSSDVLYSSAGNVREELYVNHGVYAFGWEVGGSTWNTTTRQWQAGSFQPPWAQAQGEYMEYANGVMEMFRIAADAGRDETAPTAALVPAAEGEGWAFETSEPARVFFTTDGTTPVPLPRPTDQVVPRPTTGTREYLASGIRERGETLLLASGTTVHWLAVDPAGNESVGTHVVP